MSGLIVGKSYRIGGGEFGDVVNIFAQNFIVAGKFEYDGNFLARLDADFILEVANDFDDTDDVFGEFLNAVLVADVLAHFAAGNPRRHHD